MQQLIVLHVDLDLVLLQQLVLVLDHRQLVLLLVQVGLAVMQTLLLLHEVPDRALVRLSYG